MKLWFTFEGYCFIEAENEEEAKQKFWNNYYSIKNLTNDECFEITEITCGEREE